MKSSLLLALALSAMLGVSVAIGAAVAQPPGETSATGDDAEAEEVVEETAAEGEDAGAEVSEPEGAAACETGQATGDSETVAEGDGCDHGGGIRVNPVAPPPAGATDDDDHGGGIRVNPTP